MDSVGNTYICLNGDFLHEDKPFLGLPNRAIHQGDVITEVIHTYATEPQFLTQHIRKLVAAMGLLSMEVPVHFNAADLTLLISKLLRKNRHFGGAAVRMAVFRKSSSPETPAQNEVSFVMDSRKLERDYYGLNTAGLVVDVFRDLIRHAHPLSSIRSADPLLFLKAEQYCKQNKLDECVFLNAHRRIVETVHSNIFLVKDRSVFTPSVQEGCIPGVMRGLVVHLCTSSGFRMNEQSRLSPEAMDDADEVFLADAVNGLRWVGAYRQKRYYKRATQQLLNELNQLAFEKWHKKD